MFGKEKLQRKTLEKKHKTDIEIKIKTHSPKILFSLIFSTLLKQIKDKTFRLKLLLNLLQTIEKDGKNSSQKP